MGCPPRRTGVRGQAAAKLHRGPRRAAVEMALLCCIITEAIYHEIHGVDNEILCRGQGAKPRSAILDALEEQVRVQWVWDEGAGAAVGGGCDLLGRVCVRGSQLGAFRFPGASFHIRCQ